MQFNFLIIAAAALVPLLIGFIWYHPKTFANAWMNASKLTNADLEGSNMAKIFGVTYLLSIFIALALYSMVIHQSHVMSILLNEPGIREEGSEMYIYYQDFMTKYGQNFRTFKHGLLHGVIGAIFLALPIVGINALFERRSFKYIFIHAGYWIITMGLMGGIICQWM
jgi:NADH:ubiquinone oxidoreductase subunit 6 (subunit J)